MKQGIQNVRGGQKTDLVSEEVQNLKIFFRKKLPDIIRYL